MLPADGSPEFELRDSRYFGEWGGYLFLLLSFSWRTKEITAIMTMQNAKMSYHVTIIAHPLSVSRGQKKWITPNGGTAYRGADSTKDRVTQDPTDCKGKNTGA